MRAAAISLASGVVLSGCAALNPVYTDSGGDLGPNYDRDRLATVVADGVMPVEILGNPSALEEGNFNSVVVRRLRLAPVLGPAPIRQQRHYPIKRLSRRTRV